MPTTSGDVAIEYKNVAPLLYVVGRVLDDGDQTGDSPDVVKGRTSAEQKTREIVAPKSRIFLVEKDTRVDMPLGLAVSRAHRNRLR